MIYLGSLRISFFAITPMITKTKNDNNIAKDNTIPTATHPLTINDALAIPKTIPMEIITAITKEIK